MRTPRPKIKTPDVAGLRVVKVNQTLIIDDEWGTFWAVHSIDLEGGKRILFHTHPTVDQPYPTVLKVLKGGNW